MERKFFPDESLADALAWLASAPAAAAALASSHSWRLVDNVANHAPFWW